MTLIKFIMNCILINIIFIKYSIHSIMEKILRKTSSRIINNPKIFTTDALSKSLIRQEKVFFKKNFSIKKKQKEFIKDFFK